MNCNKFISYNIEHSEISRNNEKIFNKPDFYPIQSYEIRSSQLSVLNTKKSASIANKINNSNEIPQINVLNQRIYQNQNLPIKEYYNQINDIQNNNNTPNSLKVYKAKTYKNILSKSIPKQLKNKIKFFFPYKIKIKNGKTHIIKDNNLNNKNALYEWKKHKNNNDMDLLKELKQAIKIQSSKNIESYSNKNTLLLSQKKTINNRYFINSKDDINNNNNNNEIYIIKENEKEKENILNQKHLFNHRYSAQIKRNFLNFNNKINNNINKNNITNIQAINAKESNIDVNDNSNIVKNVKTCENEKILDKKIKNKFNCYRKKHSINSEVGDSFSKIKKLNDNESTNKLGKIKNIEKFKKNKKRKKKKNKSANNFIRKIKIKISNEKNKSCNNIKCDIKPQIKEKEKEKEKLREEKDNEINKNAENENKRINFINQKKLFNSNDNKDRDNIKSHFLITKNNINDNNLKNHIIIPKNNNKDYNKNNKNIVSLNQINKKNENLIIKKDNNYTINIKTINSRPINTKIISARDKLFFSKDNNEIKNNIEKLNEKYEIKVFKELNQNLENKSKENEKNILNNNSKTIDTQPKIYSDNKTYKSPFYYKKKEDSLERIVRTRKEYMQKEKSQSVQNLTNHFYLIFPGNASYLIKNCMCHRTNWKEAFSTVTSIFNFKWQQLSYGIDYTTLGKFGSEKQLVNHFEYHYSISNKANMFINLLNYCEMRKIPVSKYVPFTIIYQIKDRRKITEEEKEKKKSKNLENLKNFVEKAYKYITEYKDLGKYYTDEKFNKEKEKRKKYNIDMENKIKKNKKENNKNGVENNDNEYSFRVENEIDGFLGEYVLYTDIFPKFEIYDSIACRDNNNIGGNTVIEIPKSHYSGKNMWVIKAINLNRGMCIKVVNSFEEMEKVIDKFQKGVDYHFTEQIINDSIQENNNINISNNQNKEENKIDKSKEENNNKEKEKVEENEIEKNENIYYCDKIIIQKYIENPLLYRGRKCDMRIWVLLTHQMKVYIFKEGHLKTCSVEYDPNSKDAYRHITNYSFQKYNDNFQKFEKGNEVPFFEFQKFIDEKYPNKNYILKKDLLKQLKDIVNITMRSVKDKINKKGKNYQFEIFGYDFMLDNDFNVYLIEINTNPGLEESSPWIKVIVPRMLDDALRLTLDQIFEPKYDFTLNYKNEEEKNNLKNVENNLKNKIDPNCVDLNSINEKIKNNEILKSNNNDENKNIEDEKNKKYISPFHVPGYELDDNLWEFVCDLNTYDPLDDKLEKEKMNEKESYTGIRHLLMKKNIKLNSEKNKRENINKENKDKIEERIKDKINYDIK